MPQITLTFTELEQAILLRLLSDRLSGLTDDLDGMLLRNALEPLYGRFVPPAVVPIAGERREVARIVGTASGRYSQPRGPHKMKSKGDPTPLNKRGTPRLKAPPSPRWRKEEMEPFTFLADNASTHEVAELAGISEPKARSLKGIYHDALNEFRAIPVGDKRNAWLKRHFKGALGGTAFDDARTVGDRLQK